MQSQVNLNDIYQELDLNQDGLTIEEVLRRKTRLFVGGLKFSSEDRVLVEYFSKFGDIKEAVIIRDRNNGFSKGYGFVTMTTHESSLKATVNKSPKLDGRKCNVNFAYIGEKKKAIKNNEFASNVASQVRNQVSNAKVLVENFYVEPNASTLFGNQYYSVVPTHHQPIQYIFVNAIEEQIYRQNVAHTMCSQLVSSNLNSSAHFNQIPAQFIVHPSSYEYPSL